MAPGPCSNPAGDKRQWDEHNKLVCAVHQYCYPGSRNKDYRTPCEFVTFRVWLAQRNRLRTGKTK